MADPTEALISVIVPAWNAERYLADALDSIRAQTAGRPDIVVVDDGSTDGTRAVAERFGARCVALASRRGIGAARNAGVAAAAGEYLTFLDADDLWVPERTAVLLRALATRPGRCIALGQAEQFICPTLDPEQRARLRLPPPPAAGYLAGGMLLRRADFLAVGPFDETLAVGEFIDWFGRARAAGLAEIVVPETVLRRRIHGHNHTLRHRVSAADYVEVARRELARKRAVDTRS